jgi:Tol biopolymer transport system component/DNA-binding winged helix-turn-helix (wHTH) protein
MMRRVTKPSFEFGPFVLDPSEQTLLRDGRPVPLTPKVFEVLRVLVEHAGHLVDKETLLKEVWPDSFVEEGALNRSVSVLRKALGESASGPKYIETVPKRGYRFVEKAVHRVENNPTPLLQPGPRAGLSRRAVAAVVVVLIAAALSYRMLRPRDAEPTARTPVAPAHSQVTFTGKAGSPTLSPDGRRIAYVSDERSEKELIVQDLAGGQPRVAYTAPEVGYLRWSPDGSELLLWARGGADDGVYVMSPDGGTPRRIVQGQYIACWSPDGSTIAVASVLVGKIWLFNKLGQEKRTLLLHGAHWSISDIDWSAATDRLVFVSTDNQAHFTIWTVRPDGTDQTVVLEDNTEITATRWAPDGNAIYYFRRANQTVSLQKIGANLPDAGARSATTVIAGLEPDRWFALSADGQRLIYTRAPYHSNLWMIEAASGSDRPTPTELTVGTSIVERPRVSPDGKSILFNMGHEPRANLYTMAITGGSPRQLTFLDSFNVAGAWSADGTRIAFASTQDGKARVWTVNRDGGMPRALSSGNLSDSFDLTWSPGSQILYQQTGNRNYNVLDPVTLTERLLVSDPLRGWIFSPVYSADGRRIAVYWNRRPHRGLWVIDVTTGEETWLYGTAGTVLMPIGWSADGRSIYAVEGKPGTIRGSTLPIGETLREAHILNVPLNGKSVTTVASFPSQEIGGLTMTPDAGRFVYTVYSSRSDVWVVDNFDR